MKLLVIDGNSIANRAFYGVRPLSTREGFPTNAIFGFLNIMRKMVEEVEPDALCVTFDRKEPTFRHLSFEGYKAQRKPMPEELGQQMPVLKETLDAMNIPRYELAGWEADDLIGTIARRCEAEGWSCVIATGDRDSLQLITQATQVDLVTSRMGKTTTRQWDEAVFQEEYGFPPIRLIDLKALMGDASDNIPGVKGVGEKTALSLLRTYGSLADIYEDLEALDVTPGVRKKLAEGKEGADMSYDLATIHCDAPLDFHPQDALRKPINREELTGILTRLEFTKLMDKLGLNEAAPEAAPVREDVFSGEVTSEYLPGPERVAELLALWERADHVCVIALPELRGVAVHMETPDGAFGVVAIGEQMAGYQALLEGLFSPAVKKVAHNVKDLIRTLLDQGLSPEGFIFDTALAAYLIAPTDGSYSLDKLAGTVLQGEFPKEKVYLTPEAFSPLSGDAAEPTGAILAHAALLDLLYEKQLPRLKELGLYDLLVDLELPLCQVLAEMEQAGFLVDRQALDEFGGMLKARIAALHQEIVALAGEEFNLNSTQQLGVILFDKLGLPPVKKTKTGYSTNVEVLEKLRGSHPIIDAIMEYRQLTKLNSTYVDGLTKVIAPDGRIHTSFQNTVTATGRLSSTEPNLQNIPVRTPLGAEMRKMFVAGPGKVLVDADYSQIELRLLAHIARDEAMTRAFQSGVDIHTLTASQVLDLPPEEVTHAQRASAKAVNFGIVYGISPFSLAQDIHATVAQAKDYMEKYFRTYAGVRRYMDEIVERAKQDGCVRTELGRWRPLPELRSSNRNLRSFGERVALNMPIQGTAADVIKVAMLRVSRRLRAEKLQARLVLQVHDELIVECPQEEAEIVKRLVKEEMEGAVQLTVPLVADAAEGKSWMAAKG